MGSPVPLSTDGFFGQRAARHFGVRGQEVSALRLEGELSLVATRLTCEERMRERTQPAPPDAAFSLLCPIDRLDGHRCWVAGEPQHSGPLPAGSVSLTDLRDKPQWQLCGRVDALQIYIPVRALAAVGERRSQPAVGSLRCDAGRPDPIIAGLCDTLMRAAQSTGSNTLLIDQLAICLLTHVAEVYGGPGCAEGRASGRLAPWQERRAKEIMAARLASELTISQLASECRLTASHFARAFRRSTGVAPQRYLMQLRVDEAKRHLAAAHLPLSDIALICGFGDQSHLTRVFKQLVGMPPGAWRRRLEPAVDRARLSA
ncbi:helix-turn-helix domain-containing protein [Bosea sp. (in: a-proteobacteria)]|uniref:helix-turn-helix domain-containing protein n=1 Tax=Bosea sp. (in: a-proteobacteria) TaxID=1871050 RepID=UPI003F6E7080